jgi:hypothetical protein
LQLGRGLHHGLQLQDERTRRQAEVCNATDEAIPNSPRSGTVWAVTIRQEALLPT